MASPPSSSSGTIGRWQVPPPQSSTAYWPVPPITDYRNKAVLAPMVRCGTLPLRLLALDYGADIVWGEELVAQKMIKTVRVVDEAAGVVRYFGQSLDGSGSYNKLVYTTCRSDRPTVFQLGTSNAADAVAAALHVHRDVSAIDVNMGCPKSFSTSGGMGAALLTKPDVVEDILKSLVRVVPRPITAKIRLLPTHAETVELARRIEACGVAALTVHGRQKHERPREPAHMDGIAAVKAALTIPVIANGDCFQHGDIARIRAETGADSVMIARGALINPSIFRADGPLPFDVVARAYLAKCLAVGNHFANSRYTILDMFKERKEGGCAVSQQCQTTKSYDELLAAFATTPEALAAEFPANSTVWGVREPSSFVRAEPRPESESDSDSGSAPSAADAACPAVHDDKRQRRSSSPTPP